MARSNRGKPGAGNDRVRVSGIDIAWDIANGVCTCAGLPVAMMWVDSTLAGLMAGVQDMAGTERFVLALQSEGRKSVEADWEVISTRADFHEGFKAIANVAAVAGWGQWELVSMDEAAKTCVFRAKNSWEGRYQKALGVCWGSAMLEGKLAGYCTRLFGTNSWAEQTAFIAKGDEYDEFTVSPSTRTIEVEIKRQLSYDAATRADMAVALRKLEREIAERREAEAALRLSERKFADIFSLSPEFMGITRQGDGLILEVNRSFEDGMGWPREEAVGRTVFQLGIWAEPQERARAVEEMRRNGQLKDFEHTYVTRQGVRRRGLVSMASLQTAAGESLFFVMRDITERKEAEEALRRSKEELASIIRVAPIGIGVVANRALTAVNDRACEMTGYECDELIGKNARILYPTDEEYEFVGREKYRQIAEKGTGSVETLWRRKDGAIINVLLSSTPMDLADLSRGVTFTALDITERRRAEEDRIELQQRLLHAQKLESLGVLAGGIAHDFNNLLMAILGNLDLALLDIPQSNPGRSRIEQAMQSARRATDLTRQMLAYSGKGRFVLAHIMLGDLVRENADLFRTAIPRTATINLHLTGEGIAIEADPGQVQQVIMNLITNAAESLGEKAGVISLATGVEDCDDATLSRSRLDTKPLPGRFAYVEVSDSGCGMDLETQQRMFDPFFTTKFTGRGLGMSAVLGIVRGHNGAIIVDSTEGGGTTVRVLLPVRDGNGPTARAGAVAAEKSPELAGKVLVVDDEEHVRNLCVAFVKRMGLDGVAATNGEEALAIYAGCSGEISCVLLDLTMPRMDGVETFRRLKELRPDVKVILCSGYNEQEAIRRFTGEGLAGFLQKPYGLSVLKDKLSQAMGRGGKKNA